MSLDLRDRDSLKIECETLVDERIKVPSADGEAVCI